MTTRKELKSMSPGRKEVRDEPQGGGQDTPEGRSGRDEGTETARSAGGDAPDTPPQPVSRISKYDTRQSCWCSCGQLTSPGKRWKPGHDQRGKGTIKRAVNEGKVDELPDRLKEYGVERGLI